MKTTTGAEIRKNLAGVLPGLRAAEVVTVTRKGRPGAQIRALPLAEGIVWPDFEAEAVVLAGKPLADTVVEARAERC